MAKIITSRHRASETEQARQYIKSRLMLPTIPLAMVTLLTGYGTLAFMWFQDILTLQALGASMVLFFVGVVMGWGQVRYERYLVRTCPEYLARKQKVLNAAKEYKRPKRDLPVGGLHHPGRRVVLLAYALAVLGMLALSITFVNKIGVYPAFFLPWAGYLNAKVIFWRQLFASP
jgi:hypothetical protein